MKIINLTFILFFYLAFIESSYSFVRTRADSGKEIFWSINGNELPFYINSNLSGTGSTQLLSESNSNSIILNSVNAWNANSPLRLSPIFSSDFSSISSTKVGTISYSNNPAIFGDGVLAVTKVSFNSVSGSINGADIIINDSYMNFSTFTSNPSLSANGFAYLGDVVTHEIGHLLGLGHTEMPGSTMLYSIFKNQFEPSTDEYIAVKDIYGNKAKRLKGTVVGGKDTAIFGAHVMLISQKNGKVITSQYSDEEGKFEFSNIATDDTYFVSILPMRNQASLPSFYQNVNTNFCEGEFLPSIFTKCGARSKGRAQGINLSNHALSELDLGKLTVKCDLGLNGDYLYEKIQSSRKSVPFYNYYKFSLGESYIGLIYDEDIQNSKADSFHLDLKHYTAGPNEYIKLNIMLESLLTALDFEIRIKNLTTETISTHQSQSDLVTGKKLIDQTIYIPLSSNSLENDFEVILTPKNLTSYQRGEIFAGPSGLNNEKKVYLLTTSLVQKSGALYQSLELVDSYPYEDNQSCLEGEVTYKATASRELANDTSQNKEESSAVSCATIGPIDGSGGGSGPLSFLMGFVLIIILSIPRFNRSNFLSK